LGLKILTMRQIAERVARHLGRAFSVEHMTREADIENLTAHDVSVDFAT
jgi:hypothetical protein